MPENETAEPIHDAMRFVYENAPIELHDKIQMYHTKIVESVLVLKLQNKELREALTDLLDHQNGPPIHGGRHEAGWNRAMNEAKRLLGRDG